MRRRATPRGRNPHIFTGSLLLATVSQRHFHAPGAFLERQDFNGKVAGVDAVAVIVVAGFFIVTWGLVRALGRL